MISPVRLAVITVMTAAVACAHVGPNTGSSPSSSADSTKGDSNEVIKPYDKVVTAKAVTQRGLVITHRIGEKLYFELPRSIMGSDLLLMNSIAQASAGQDSQYGGDWNVHGRR
jgi:hypothetical protein